MDGFLLQATIYLCAAVIAVPLAKRFGLGSVLGYLIAGVVIGPIAGLVGGSETENLQHFAEFGVVMMLFVVGLELEPRALWDMRHRLIGLGGLQISLTTIAIMFFAILLGQRWSVGFAIGLTFALSSTAIVLQTLNEKGLMQTNGGRSSFSVLLTQDIAVIPMLALLPLFALHGLHNSQSEADGHDVALSLVEGLPGWGVTLMTIGAVATIIIGGHFGSRHLFRFIAMSRLREMFTAVSLLLVVGIALLMTLVGLSPALGAFLAGVVLANSEFRHELESDIEPFKGLLLGLFFITVGAGIDFSVLFRDYSAFFSIIGLVIGVMVIKGGILLFLANLFGITGRDRWLFSLGLAQAGEFGFVLLSFTVKTNVIPASLSQTLSIVVALSMVLTPALFILYEKLAERAAHAHDKDAPKEDEIDEQENVIIVGIGRFGQVVNRMALASGIKTIVLDRQIDAIEAMRQFGVKGFFGDPTRPDLMQSAGLMQAKVLVVAVDDLEAAVKLVTYARRQRPDLHIIVRAYDRNHVYRLYRAGANDIVRENFDSSVRAGRYLLEQMGWNAYDVQIASETFVKADRHALQELAQLWDPDIPNTQNKAFMEHARAITKEMNTSFLTNVNKDIEEEKKAKERLEAKAAES